MIPNANFLLYELSPDPSVGEQVIWSVQNYYLHHYTFPKLYLVSIGTNHSSR